MIASEQAVIGDQSESSLEPEKQLALWQGEIAREAQQGRGIDALQRVLSKLRKEFKTDEVFLFRAIDDVQRCADRHLSERHEPETINSIFQAIFPDLNSNLDDETIKIDVENEVRRLANRYRFRLPRQCRQHRP
jgi:hypothetical protein